MSMPAAPARQAALHSLWVEMSSESDQLIVVVTPRPGDEAGPLPVRLSEITGRSRTQLAIELQRGEVEVLRSADRGEVSRIVEQLAAIGLLAVVREASVADARSAAPVAGEGWGRVLGAFDAKVAVAPSRLPERSAAARGSGTESWQPSEPLALRVGEADTSAPLPLEQAANDRGWRSPTARSVSTNEVSLDLMREAGGLDLPSGARAKRGANKARALPKRLSVRTVAALLVLLVMCGVGFALYQRMHRVLTPGLPPAPMVAPVVAPIAPDSAATQPPPEEQVRLLVDRAREACRSAEFERCKELADQALDLDETNRAAQAVHIKAVTAISAQAGRPSPNPTPAVGPQ